MKSPSGDILDGVTQVILPALNGLASAQHLQTITDHLVANRIAQQVDISDADLAEYTQRTTNWMRGYFVAGGKFNVRTESFAWFAWPSAHQAAFIHVVGCKRRRV